MNYLKEEKKGFIKTIILIIVALIILGYFGFDVENIIKSERVQKNLNYVWDIVSKVWTLYLAAPVMFVWDKFFVGVVWKTIVSVLN
ncbi:MAG: hypothetical protein WC827_01310 [Candidatus Paceibacterota bacterium]|jgi:hypothetical protein